MENVRKAVVINGSVVQISRMVGPALAGWTIGIFGVAPAFWINGISFIAVIASLIAIKSSQVIHSHHGNPLNDFLDGWCNATGFKKTPVQNINPIKTPEGIKIITNSDDIDVWVESKINELLDIFQNIKIEE